MVGGLERRTSLSRRQFLKELACFTVGISCSSGWADLLESMVFPKPDVDEVLNEIWDGRINLTFIEIVGYACGQIQTIKFNSQTQAWDSEYVPTFAWIHRYPNNPYALRGFFFIHRSNLSLVEKEKGLIPSNAEIRFYANWNHDLPVLQARVGMKAVYSALKIDDPADPLVKLVAQSSRTIALVTCHPPDYQGENFPQRLVYFAWAFLPETPTKKRIFLPLLAKI